MTNTTTTTTTTDTSNCHPLKIILDRNEAAEKRASAMLAMICSNPNSRSNHRDLTVANVDVQKWGHRGTSVIVESHDIETYLHIVSVVTREVAENGYSVEVHQHGWDVEFTITESMFVDPVVVVDDPTYVVTFASSEEADLMYWHDWNGWSFDPADATEHIDYAAAQRAIAKLGSTGTGKFDIIETGEALS